MDDARFNRILIGIVLIAIVAISALAYFIGMHEPGPEQELVRYGLYEFERQGPVYVLDYQKDMSIYTIHFTYLPDEVLDIPVYGTLRGFREPIHLSFDPEMSEQDKAHTQKAFYDISRKLIGIYGHTPRTACTHEHPECGDAPIMTCETGSGMVVYPSQEPRIVFEERCATVYASGEDIVRAEHLISYLLLGIIR